MLIALNGSGRIELRRACSDASHVPIPNTTFFLNNVGDRGSIHVLSLM